ncbi:MAG: hypothetical protein KAH23_05280 [Kiritimatiellae bacterium]|nr:hypothetical protein [Kiritimatiellia bacterium]
MKQYTESMEPFKTCTLCHTTWLSRDDFLSDSSVELIGYQVDFEELVAGFFLLNHDCGTTLTVSVAELKELYAGPVFETRRTGTDDCPGHCLRKDDLEPCSAKCECVFVRDIIQIVKNWPKSGDA